MRGRQGPHRPVRSPIRDLSGMLANLDPWLDPHLYAFLTADTPQPGAIATVREEEGWSSVVPSPEGTMRRIVLRVHSSLDGIGLTAAVATRLASRGIGCNMVAAFHHDHLFVPTVDAERAMGLLQSLQAEALSGSSPAAGAPQAAPRE